MLGIDISKAYQSGFLSHSDSRRLSIHEATFRLFSPHLLLIRVDSLSIHVRTDSEPILQFSLRVEICLVPCRIFEDIPDWKADVLFILKAEELAFGVETVLVFPQN